MDVFGTKKALRRVQDRLDELSETQDNLGRSIRALKLEWEETYDKIYRLFQRLIKRQAVDYPPPGPPLVEPGPDAPDVDEISAKIHARRAAGKG